MPEKTTPSMAKLIAANDTELTDVTCSTCQASCCRLEVFLITDTGVPEHFVRTDQYGGRTMNQLDDGWCAALNRNTMNCMIYEKRPLVCREFATGSHECLVERAVP